MMKLILIRRIAEMLYTYGDPSKNSARWDIVYRFVASEIFKFNVETKNGKKMAKSINLADVDFTLLDDEKLVELYDIVSRRFWMQM